MKPIAWKPIRGYEGLYEISDKGQVKSLIGWNGKRYINREKILKPTKTTTGYWKIELVKNKNRKSKKIHRLIAIAFIPNPEKKPNINHIDGNPLNNSLENIEWCTQKENVDHALRIGLRKLVKIPQKELEELYLVNKNSLRMIGNTYGLSATTVARRLEKLGIKRRSLTEKKTKYFLTEELVLRELQIKTQKQLAKEVGCDPSLISHYLRKIKEKEKIYA